MSEIEIGLDTVFQWARAASQARRAGIITCAEFITRIEFLYELEELVLNNL